MAAPKASVFYSAVERILGSWTVLQLAVQHGFGGQYSEAKAKWMPEAIEQWFTENENIEPEELEDFLASLLDTEFNTVADDGSLPEIARTICGYWRLAEAGDEGAVMRQIAALPRADVTASRGQQNDDDDEEEDEDEVAPQAAPLPTGSIPACPPASSQEREETPMEQEEEAEDGWTVVRKTKRR